MVIKEFVRAIDQIAQEKGIPKERVVETIEAALAAAYKKEYGKRGEVIRAHLDFGNNAIQFRQIKIAVDKDSVRIIEEGERAQAPKLMQSIEEVSEQVEARASEQEEGEKKLRYNPDRHIFIEEARAIKPDAQLEEEIEFPLETHEDFGRIAAQTAKQVVIQKLREAERLSLFEEYRNKEGQLISGIVQNFERGNVYINLGKTTGVMFGNETIPVERYSPGQRLRFYVLGVQEEGRLPGVILSRAHPKFVEKLFELEVPEIAEGVVEAKAIAREPGNRTKIAVASKDEHIDPVGSCVGQRGSRVMAVINELGQEKIDIIPWSDDPAKFVANALSPAKVKRVEIRPRREALVYVGEDQLSLAIGRGGQNVRLAAKLTGWKIDVRSQAEPEKVQEGGIAQSEEEKATEIEKEKSEKEEFDLGSLPVVGPKGVGALRSAGLGSLEKLQAATKEELLVVEGVGEKTAQKILDHLRQLK